LVKVFITVLRAMIQP